MLKAEARGLDIKTCMDIRHLSGRIIVHSYVALPKCPYVRQSHLWFKGKADYRHGNFSFTSWQPELGKERPDRYYESTGEVQGRIQDFKLGGGGGGGAHLKKLRRAEGGAKICGVFRVKNHDFTPKNHIFSNFRGARAGCAPPPPLDPPLKSPDLSMCVCKP